MPKNALVASALQRDIMPRKNRRSGKTGKRQPGKTGNSSSVDSELMRMNKGAALSDVERTDLQRRPRNWLMTETPPKSFLTDITWVKFQRSVVITTQTSAITETNFQFRPSDFAQTAVGSGAFNLVFDQYTIYSVVMSIVCPEYPGSGAVMPLLVTAIDYDGPLPTLGNIAAIQSYASSTTVVLAPGMSVVRYIKPCLAGGIWGGSSVNATGPQRLWVDNVSDVPFYGIRTMFQASPPAALTYDVTLSYVFGFRNTT